MYRVSPYINGLKVMMSCELFELRAPLEPLMLLQPGRDSL